MEKKIFFTKNSINHQRTNIFWSSSCRVKYKSERGVLPPTRQPYFTFVTANVPGQPGSLQAGAAPVKVFRFQPEVATWRCSILGSGRSPGVGNGNAFQCSCLENPTDRGAWRATVPGVTESYTTAHGQKAWPYPLPLKAGQEKKSHFM